MLTEQEKIQRVSKIVNALRIAPNEVASDVRFNYTTRTNISLDTFLYNYGNCTFDKKIITQAALALPLLFTKQNFKLLINKISNTNLYRDYTNYDSDDQQTDIISINQCTRYDIENLDKNYLTNIGDEIKNELYKSLKQTPRHVIKTYLRPNVLMVTTNRMNVALIIETLLLYIRYKHTDKNIEINQELRELLDKIFIETQKVHGEVDIDISTFIDKISSYIIDIYDKIFDLENIVNTIEMNRLKETFNAFERVQSRYVNEQIEVAQECINSTLQLLNDKYTELYNAQDTQLAFQENKKKQQKQIIDTIKDSKQITIRSAAITNEYNPATATLQIAIKLQTLLTNIDYVSFEKGLIRSKETTPQTLRARFRTATDTCLKLLYLLLMNGPKYAIKVFQTLTINIKSNSKISLTTEFVSRNSVFSPADFSTILLVHGAIPNPHINYYDCYGTAAAQLTKYSDATKFFKQYLDTLTGSVGNLNINDNTVFNKFIWICNFIVHPELPDVAKDIKLFTNLETGEDISIRQLMQSEDFTNAPNRIEDFV